MTATLEAEAPIRSAGFFTDHLGQFITRIRVIDPVRCRRAQVRNFVSQPNQIVPQFGLQVEPGMIGGNGDAHASGIPVAGENRSRTP